MHLDDQELLLLARFFAKRFPDPQDRAPILARAGLPGDDPQQAPEAAWERILRAAQEADALPRLGRAVRCDDPNDENLREMRRLLAGPAGGPSRTRVLVAAAGALVLLCAAGGAVGVATALGGPDSTSTVPPPRQETAATVARSLPAPEPVSIPEPPSEPAVAALEPSEPAPAVEAVAEGTAEAVETLPEHCSKLEPEVQGYWYAGSEPPGVIGDIVIVPRDVNVRSSYPRFSNGYDTEAPVQCVLYGGDLVKLHRAPIHVPFNRYWVVSTPADLVASPPWGSLDVGAKSRGEGALYAGDRVAGDPDERFRQEHHRAPPPTEIDAQDGRRSRRKPTAR